MAVHAKDCLKSTHDLPEDPQVFNWVERAHQKRSFSGRRQIETAVMLFRFNNPTIVFQNKY